jgi:type III secretion system FlhB-like substrate exporter
MELVRKGTLEVLKYIISTTKEHSVDMQQDTAIKEPAYFCYFSETITTVFMHIKDFHLTNFISYI